MDNQYKKLVPCIYLYKGNAVKSLSDITIIDTNPVMLAKYYSDNHGDELLIFDMSKGDFCHIADFLYDIQRLFVFRIPL